MLTTTQPCNFYNDNQQWIVLFSRMNYIPLFSLDRHGAVGDGLFCNHLKTIIHFSIIFFEKKEEIILGMEVCFPINISYS